MAEVFQISDEELLKLVKKGEHHALETLYRRYFHMLCSFAHKYVRSNLISEEVVSDVFLYIWLKREEMKIPNNLRAYLFTAVKNRSMNYLQSDNRHFEDIYFVEKNRSLSADSADSHILQQELEDEIEKIISQLPPKRQLIFRMNRIDGLKYKEIAQVLSITVRTVQNHMVEAVRFIANHYSRIKSQKYF
ncbi:MAG: RNA polymerase sigma-70 factor [Bacteroidota bacterium]